MITMAQKRFEMHLNPNLDGSYRIALNLAGNTEDASDLVQESALRAFRSFHTFQEGTNFRAWFYRIITNLFLEWSRKRQREHISNEDVDVYLNNHFHNVRSHSPSPVADVIEKWTSNACIMPSIRCRKNTG
jgi:RNA polymerase sigma factor (sigma-70 family)